MEKGSFIPPSDKEVEEICRLINSNLGFKYSIDKKYLITSRLNRRLLQLNLDNYRQYLEHLRVHPEEKSILFELLTTNITSFFREPKQFTYLKTRLLPELNKAKVENSRAKLRCWSAGCSSGEEAYSVAISCLENPGAKWDVRVLASDINAAQLKTGAEGKYHAEQVKAVPPEWLEKYFIFLNEEEGDFYRVIPGLRQRVFFRQMNLLDDQSLPSHLRFSIIFCRNVIIYLNNRARQKLLNIFYRRLEPGGHLFLGHSEFIDTVADTHWFALGNCIYQKKADRNGTH